MTLSSLLTEKVGFSVVFETFSVVLFPETLNLKASLNLQIHRWKSGKIYDFMTMFSLFCQVVHPPLWHRKKGWNSPVFFRCFARVFAFLDFRQRGYDCLFVSAQPQHHGKSLWHRVHLVRVTAFLVIIAVQDTPPIPSTLISAGSRLFFFLAQVVFG